MLRQLFIFTLSAMALAAILSGCASSSLDGGPMSGEVFQERYAGDGDFAVAPAAAPAFMEMPAEEGMASSVVSNEFPGQTSPVSGVVPNERMIIKTGEMSITVDDTAVAVQNATDAILGAEGYIISQRVWESGGYTYATMQLGVPVAQFERLMGAMRRLGEVTNDVASGQDVTNEFVDLNARLGNLIATRDRLRTFLEQAENISEILAVNAELSRVEGEIEALQGRVNYLAGRAAFSTLTLSFNPVIPLPTPWPTAVPASWNPLSTAGDAAEDLVATTQTVVDAGIYLLIFCGPWALIGGLILLGGYRLVQRRRGSGKNTAVAPPTNE